MQRMDPGFLKLLDDDEDDNTPAAADVDAFAAMLKGDLGGNGQAAAAAAAAAALGVARSGNGSAQLLSQAPAASVAAGHGGTKGAPGIASQAPSQQQLLWNQLTKEQQGQLLQRRALQQQRLQQRHQQNQQGGAASGTVGNKKTALKDGISFTALMPLLQPHLPPSEAQRLQDLYDQFKTNEITREDFVRGTRHIAGDKVLIQTLRRMQQQTQQQNHPNNPQTLQQQKPLQQQKQFSSQPPPSQPQSSQSQQLLPPFLPVGVPPEITNQEKQQQQSKEKTTALQPAALSSVQSQEQTATSAAPRPKLPVGDALAPTFQQLKVPSNLDHKSLSQGSQSQSQLSTSMPQAQSQSSSVQPEGQNQETGQWSNSKTAAPVPLHQVKNEAGKSLGTIPSARPQLVSTKLPALQPRPPASVAHQSQSAVVMAAGQSSQPYSQLSMPQVPFSAQPAGHVRLPPPQPVPQLAGAVPLVQSSAPLPSQSQSQSQPQPQSQPQLQPQPQPQPDKPLSKYARQKLRREQKKREEEERQKKLMEEEISKKLQCAQEGVVTTSQQGLQSLQPPILALQAPGPKTDVNNQFHPGSLSHQAQLQAPKVDKQQAVSSAAAGLAGKGHSQTLVHVKQEASDIQSDQKRQPFHLPDSLPAQVAKRSTGQAQLSGPFIISSTSASHVHEQASNAEQEQVLSMQGAIASNSAQQGGVTSVPTAGVVPIPSFAGTSGLQSTVSAKQKAISASPATPTTSVYNAATSLAGPPFNPASPAVSATQLRQSSQPATSVSATPATKTPKRPGVGQKKSAESALAQPPASKKQKTAAGEPDQSIDQLNDVTAVSGVNLKEEEEQLLIGPKEESRTTEAMRKVVQEEEEKLFLERGALQTKVAGIAGRCGVKDVHEDVGRCLSMAVEERLRSMLYSLIKFSKQRCDVAKERHKVVITSDVRRQILLMRRKAKETMDKKMAEENERLRKLNEKKDKGSIPDLEREELKAKAQKAQQEQEDRLKANAANVAARAAVGADDMLLKWQMMAAQGRQKRTGGREVGAGEEGAAANQGSLTMDGGFAPKYNKKAENGDASAAGPGSAELDPKRGPNTSATGRQGLGGGTSRDFSGRRTMMSKSTRGERLITTKDVIAFLEMEPQMCKSTLLYRLFEREQKTGDPEKGRSNARH